MGRSRHTGAGGTRVLRLSQQPDRLALVLARRAGLLARLVGRRAGTQGAQLLGMGPAQREARESASTVRKGSMPPWYYPWASLTATERQALVRGLEATVGRK